MGRRTINAHALTFNKFREPSNLLSPSCINEKSLVDIVEEWCRELGKQGPTKVREQTFVNIKHVERFNDYILIVDTMAGKSGENGTVYDTAGLIDDIPINEKQVPMSGGRAILLCPPRGQMALWFSEYSERSSGARSLLTLLRRAWPSFETGATFNEVRVIACEEALEAGKITEIEVRFVRRASDISDGIDVKAGTLSHSYKPNRKNSLSAGLISVFRQNPARAYELVELREPVSNDRDIFVSVDVGGHKRKIQISNLEDGVYFHEELNGAGEPMLSNNSIVAFCCEEASVYLERRGYSWDTSWSSKK